MITRHGKEDSVELVNKELIKRVLVAIIGIPLLLYVFYIGGIALFLLIEVLAIIGLWEYRCILFKKRDFGYFTDLIPTLFIFFATALYDPQLFSLKNALLMLLFFIVIKAINLSLTNKPIKTKHVYILTYIGWFYLGFFSGLIYRLGNEFSRPNILLLLLVFIWLTDSAAYFIGMKFGRHRGVFPVSPLKSMEGFLAGILAPLLVIVIIKQLNDNWPLAVLLLTAICAGIFGQIGDLMESKIKRLGCVKDSSNIIPGHGGVLDRFDSLLVASPVLYLLLKIIS